MTLTFRRWTSVGVRRVPLLAISVILDQIRGMCKTVVATQKAGGTVAAGSYMIIDNTKYSDSELAFLEELFGMIDM